MGLDAHFNREENFDNDMEICSEFYEMVKKVNLKCAHNLYA